MAVVYFTSNAATGVGSLAEAVANAQPGDVVRPDESVFERGSTIEIVLASTLNVDKDLTLDASPFRVRLNGGGSTPCANITDGATVEFFGFDFVGSYGAAVTTTGDVTFERCWIAGANGDGVVADGEAVALKNSVVCGNNGAAVVASSAVIDGSTVVGNVDALDVVDVIVNNSIVPGSPNVASSQIGFVVAPPDDLTPDNWTSELWRSWDLRLLDDASPNPSPYRDSGDVGAMSRYDLQGNFRGRETNGVATCSPGAYETIQADLFWVGVDATGAEVVSPSFRASEGWAASRFATVADNVAPKTGNAVFIDGATTFSDMPSERLYFTIGGFSNVVMPKGGSFQVRTLYVGARSVFQGSLAVSYGAHIGAWARLVDFFAPSGEADFDVESSADYIRYFSGLVSAIPKYGVVELQSSEGALRVPSALECSILRIRHAVNASDCRIVVDGSAAFRAKTIELTNNRETTGALFSDGAQVVFALRDAAKITQSNAPEIWADEFVVDVTEATSATLTLNGQTVYGDAPTCDVSLTGAAKVDGRGLDVASLTLNADAQINLVNDAQVVATNIVVASIATATGSGTFFVPTSQPMALTLEDGVLWANTTAGVTSISVSASSATNVMLIVTKTDDNANIVAQFSDDGGANWQDIATEASANEYELTVTPYTDVTVRVAGPGGWITKIISTAPFLPVWQVSNGYEYVTGVVNAYEIAPGGSNTGNNAYNLSGWGTL